MECVLRKWRKEDAADLAKALSNPHVQDNLRDEIPVSRACSESCERQRETKRLC